MRLENVATPISPAALTTERVSSEAFGDGSRAAAGSGITRDCSETERGSPLSGENKPLGVLNHFIRQLIRIVALAWRTSPSEKHSTGFDSAAQPAH